MACVVRQTTRGREAERLINSVGKEATPATRLGRLASLRLILISNYLHLL